MPHLWTAIDQPKTYGVVDRSRDTVKAQAPRHIEQVFD